METAEAIHTIEDALDATAAAIPPEARSFLGGEWLGHPLHPMLTDLPIGFWTSSFVLDFLGFRRSRRISTAFVGLGIASAVPTVGAGLVEFQKIEDESKRQTAAIHMAANATGTFFYLWSFLARLRGKRGKGVFLGLLGATAMTVGGYLGGKLAFGESDDEATPPVTASPDGDRMRVAV